ncbi:MAG: hypothetical protein ACJATI_005497 [Halioglobus sp.]|jgi:hypothetical protein
MNISDFHVKVQQVINTLTMASFINKDIPFVDEEILHRIVVREGAKAYHHKTVDNDNEYGFFLSYKNLCRKISLIFLEINPQYKYPKALASTLVETCNNNIYFAEHLPRLTDLDHSAGKEEGQDQLFDMLFDMVMANLNYKQKATKIK